MLRAVMQCLLSATPILAAGSNSVPEPPQAAPATRTPEGTYNEGLKFKAANRWSDAEAAFREATTLKPDFPEAWSELGHALKKRGLYDESLSAYQQALHLRPNFPQAMEYLGETYLYMGKRSEQMLDRLRSLDPTLAAQLEKAMGGGASGY